MKYLLYTFITGFLLLTTACSTQKGNHEPNFAQKETQINSFLNQWHHAAAVADEKAFFSVFSKDGIYIGTDATEHWKARELEELFKPAFQKESAWDFKPYDRHIYFSDNGKIAWFDELLTTWMGICRGSGVLEFVDNQWKIKHYHLAVAVPNDKIESYLEIIKK